MTITTFGRKIVVDEEEVRYAEGYKMSKRCGWLLPEESLNVLELPSLSLR